MLARGPILVSISVAVLLIVAAVSPTWAQTTQTAPDPAIRRWFEIQTLTLFSRYRLIENSVDVTTANQLQYKDAFKARFNLDHDRALHRELRLFQRGQFHQYLEQLGCRNG